MKPAQMDLSHGESIDETAARWRLRLFDPHVSDGARHDFDAWLNAAPQHRAAYDAMDRAHRTAGAAAADPEVLKMRAAALHFKPPAKRHSYIGPTALAASLLLAAAFWWLVKPQPPTQVLTAGGLTNIQNAERGEYATQVGERATLRLIDGSIVTLDTASTVSLDLTGHDREVRLLAGQASFDVAKDPSHPFVVYAADRRITAVGTAFDVRLGGQTVSVVLVEGKVAVDQLAVSPKQASSAPPARTNLQAGEELTAAFGGESKVHEANLDRSMSWREGRLVFESDRLSDAVMEMNRYAITPIVIADASIGDLKISGVFNTGKPEAFTHALTEYFQIDAATEGPATVLRWRR